MEWIKIEDKEPPNWGTFLVCLKNNAVFMATYSGKPHMDFLTMDFGRFNERNPVTHWMDKPAGANE